jgi:hypothetical protein
MEPFSEVFLLIFAPDDWRFESRFKSANIAAFVDKFYKTI